MPSGLSAILLTTSAATVVNMDEKVSDLKPTVASSPKRGDILHIPGRLRSAQSVLAIGRALTTLNVDAWWIGGLGTHL